MLIILGYARAVEYYILNILKYLKTRVYSIYMHEFLFGHQLSDKDCLDLHIEQKHVDSGIQSQIDFVIVFNVSEIINNQVIIDKDEYYRYEIQHIISRHLKHSYPEYVLCDFRGKTTYAAIFWHD